MVTKYLQIPLAKNPNIQMRVIPGHFATSKNHLSHYLDLYDLKTNTTLAREVAGELVLPFMNTPIDTIVCMEGTEVIGAYMAEELQMDGQMTVNSGNEIHVLTPMHNAERKLMLLSGLQDVILNKNSIVLLSSISSGGTLGSVLDLLDYYGANIQGAAAIFSAFEGKSRVDVHSLFSNYDIPSYHIYETESCPYCSDNRELDAIIYHDGMLKLH